MLCKKTVLFLCISYDSFSTNPIAVSKVRNKPITNRSYCHTIFSVTSFYFGCTRRHSLMLSSHPFARRSSGTCSDPLSCSCPCLHSDPASHLALSSSHSLALSFSRAAFLCFLLAIVIVEVALIALGFRRGLRTVQEPLRDRGMQAAAARERGRCGPLPLIFLFLVLLLCCCCCCCCFGCAIHCPGEFWRGE